ncbi:MAG: hypothetical protein EBS19_08660 [Spirochaetia bacterium]|nr:hypothetical protein [Spirochaetia bacterium]
MKQLQFIKKNTLEWRKEWMPKILNLIDKNQYDPRVVVTKKVSWEDAEKAYLEEETKLVVVR